MVMGCGGGVNGMGAGAKTLWGAVLRAGTPALRGDR